MDYSAFRYETRSSTSASVRLDILPCWLPLLPVMMRAFLVGLWSQADKPNPHTSIPALVGCAVLFFLGITLALGYPGSWEPWLYPLYYVVLLFPRQHFDDLRCAAKYGDLWTAYVKRVPYKIIPLVY